MKMTEVVRLQWSNRRVRANPHQTFPLIAKTNANKQTLRANFSHPFFFSSLPSPLFLSSHGDKCKQTCRKWIMYQIKTSQTQIQTNKHFVSAPIQIIRKFVARHSQEKPGSARYSAKKTPDVLYFWKACTLRISNMIPRGMSGESSGACLGC